MIYGNKTGGILSDNKTGVSFLTIKQGLSFLKVHSGVVQYNFSALFADIRFAVSGRESMVYQKNFTPSGEKRNSVTFFYPCNPLHSL